MASRPIPADLLPWALSSLSGGLQDETGLTLVAGDASNRRYFRLQRGNTSYIVAEAPPATEKNEAFVAVRHVLSRAGVTVPMIHAVDYARGYMLLEDLGDHSLLPALNTETVDSHYQQAFFVLDKMASIGSCGWPDGAYDHALLSEELSRFPAWFVEGLLDYSVDAQERQLLERFNAALIDSALEQPLVLVHRDFHSLNLMLQPGGELAVIDFQDAVVGPVTYDLVSLLRDCYIRWPADKVERWALSYRQQLRNSGQLTEVEEELFLRWFDWMGLERHIKVLGTFARLHLRDGKPGYLDDLPLAIDYVEEILLKYADEEAIFSEFYGWFRARLSPLIAQQAWSDRVAGQRA